MEKLKQSLIQSLDRLDKLNVRERTLIFVTVLALTLFVGMTLFIEPTLNSIKKSEAILSSVDSQLTNINDKILAQANITAINPNDEVQTKITEIQQKLSLLDKSLKNKTIDLIPPEMMLFLVRGVLEQQQNLKLINIRNKPVEVLFEPKTSVALADNNTEKNGTNNSQANTTSQTKGVVIYKHPLEFTVETTFANSLNYLQSLEILKWKFYWDSVEYIVDQHPRARMIITIHTLSTEQNWIRI